jgi:excinuclease ABC subunit C
LVELQKIFRFRTCNLDIQADDPKRRFFRPCLLHSIHQCTAPCGARIEKDEYRKIVKDFVRFLRSKRSTVLRNLQQQMDETAKNLRYEEAGMLRDRIRLIESLDSRGTPSEHVQPEAFASDPTEALVKLRDILQMPNQVRIIEGIDIANISGAEAVGSLVKFIDGRPFKNGYRRFKIKTVKGIDDYAMIAEVVRRRYKYALRGEELWPDLILIDGGLGHLRAAETALKEMIADPDALPGRAAALRPRVAPRAADEPVEMPHTKLASIAKREEDIYLQGSAQPLKLGAHSPVRKLLQCVRDEAHRFAQHYHHLLRTKKMLNENP